VKKNQTADQYTICIGILILLSKTNKNLEAGRVAQVADHLPSKREALSSNPNTKKKASKQEKN
jgi:hypothetical protein